MIFIHKTKGSILVQTLVFASIAVLLMTSLTVGVGTSLKASRQVANREQALQIAEAGIEYYRWHLAHDQDDYQDGTGGPGPYVHDFFDTEGEKIGEFELDITPPPSGSTIVTVRSTGTVLADEDVRRTVEAQLAIPSFARFAVVANDRMRFGEGTEVFGPIHSNQGIRFDGLTHNIVSSAQTSYDDPDHTGSQEFAVHTHVNPRDPLPPSSVPSRPDVFEAGREFPVPVVDFIGITSDLSQIKADAQANGFYRAGSGSLGYEIILRPNDTFDLYRVTSLWSPSSSCNSNSNAGIAGWGLWSRRNRNFVGNFANPANNLIFIEDNLWVSGQINSARLTIAAARFPDNAATRASITVNSDLLYTNYDGEDVIALMAQNNINVGYLSDDDLQIDAALIAQNGRVGRYYYASACGASYIRNSITLNGMIGTNSRYGFAYTDGTGYQIRNINYDTDLLYGPPPSFPLTSDQYEIISWREIE